jgi:hypothetical protein
MKDGIDRTSCDPEGILPVQLPSGARCDADTSGTRALMLAILEDATLCIERARGRRYARTRRQAAEAEKWISSDCREWLFSFASICDVLGFDPDALRVRLLAQVERSANSGHAGPVLARVA